MAELCLWALVDNGYEELYIKSSSIEGKGLFTCKNLPSNTIIYSLNFNGPKQPFSKSKLGELIGINKTGLPESKADEVLKRINHSCKPNAFLDAYGRLINTTFIFADNEININYSNILTEYSCKFNCLCNEDTCMGTVGLYHHALEPGELIYERISSIN